MGVIQLLDAQTADKIAAGEVIERPLSVVKELIENSIDADSTLIEIELKDGGIGLIAVRDNGCGMTKEDLTLAFMRHATSKLKNINDLNNLHSLGFRGEALASIAAVSQIEMTSALHGSIHGHKITLTLGSVPVVTEIAASGGTNIEVKNLFYNIPARRKFLKSPAYESGLISELVTKYALGHPEIRFRLINNRKMVFDTANMNSTEERMRYFYGENIAPAIIRVPKVEFAPMRFLEMYLLREEISRNNRAQELFFVNGRLIKNQALSQALEEGYHTLLAKGRFPIAIVNLSLPGEEIDVNIHPAKLEIKINNFEVIKQAIITYVRDALWQAAISKNAFLLEDYRPKDTVNTPYIADFTPIIPVNDKAEQAEIPAQNSPNTGNEYTYQSLPEIKKKILAKEAQAENISNIATMSSENCGESNTGTTAEAIDQKINIPLDTPIKADFKQTALFQESSFAAKDNSMSVAQLKKPKKSAVNIKDITELSLIGQLNNSFILAQNKEGLFIIDQHTLHERILYERFKAMVEANAIISENLLLPVMVQLTPKEESTLISCIINLRDLGFIIEEFGERSYLIRAVPQGLAKDADLKQLLLDLLGDLENEKTITMAVLKENVINQAACKAAVKANAHLRDEEMLELLAELDYVQNAHTCPHGRPIFYKISMSELYSIFKRGAYHE